MKKEEQVTLLGMQKGTKGAFITNPEAEYLLSKDDYHLKLALPATEVNRVKAFRKRKISK